MLIQASDVFVYVDSLTALVELYCAFQSFVPRAMGAAVSYALSRQGAPSEHNDHQNRDDLYEEPHFYKSRKKLLSGKNAMEICCHTQSSFSR